MNKCRNFLMLQGPIGPFFKELSDDLKVHGHRVVKVNFWGGDHEFFPEGYSFTGGIEEWPRYFLRLCQLNSITDLVLFGDRREYHEIAIEVAAHTNSEMRVWVFEEGYFRPNWVTLDQFGVNARSALPTTYRDLIHQVENLREVRDPGSTQVEAWIREFSPVAAKYYLSGFLKSGTFPNFKYHRKSSAWKELAGWGVSLGAKLVGVDPAGDLDKFKAMKVGRHFVAPLQLEGDFQMRKYSPFKKNMEFLEYLIQSFSRFSRNDDVLVVKSHPYDYGWTQWKSLVAEIAEKHKVEDRVLFIHQCHQSDVMDGCSGCVTINSTFGLNALEHGVPVKALGKVFWNAEYLTTSGELDHFWGYPKPVDPDVFSLFKQFVMTQTQFNGGFYSAQGRALCVKKLAKHLSTAIQDTQSLSEAPRARLNSRHSRKEALPLEILPKRRKLDLSL